MSVVPEPVRVRPDTGPGAVGAEPASASVVTLAVSAEPEWVPWRGVTVIVYAVSASRPLNVQVRASPAVLWLLTTPPPSLTLTSNDVYSVPGTVHAKLAGGRSSPSR